MKTSSTSTSFPSGTEATTAISPAQARPAGQILQLKHIMSPTAFFDLDIGAAMIIYSSGTKDLLNRTTYFLQWF